MTTPRTDAILDAGLEQISRAGTEGEIKQALRNLIFALSRLCRELEANKTAQGRPRGEDVP
jgi:hypothetical protein